MTVPVSIGPRPTGAPGLPVSECFTTLQGEGPAAGRPATFIRLGGCNLACSWCDSPYTWDPTRYDLRAEIIRRDTAAIAAEVTAPIAVITGGEPTLHQHTPAWADLLGRLVAAGVEVHLETNGTTTPTEVTAAAVTLAVVSPKLDHAAADARTGKDPVVPSALRAWAALAPAGRAILKVVVQTEADCHAALTLARAYGWPTTALWLMPEGTTTGVLQARWPWVAAFAATHGCNATHRLHVLAWGDERGH